MAGFFNGDAAESIQVGLGRAEVQVNDRTPWVPKDDGGGAEGTAMGHGCLEQLRALGFL